MEFYSTVAQVIPVVMLVIAFEIGLTDDDDALDKRIAMFVLAGLLVGEAAALKVIYEGTDDGWQAPLIAVTLIAGGIFALMGMTERWIKETENDRTWWLLTTAVLAGVLAIAVFG